MFGFLFTHFLCHKIFFSILFPLFKIPIQKARSFVFSNDDGQDISCRSMMFGASRFMGANFCFSVETEYFEDGGCCLFDPRYDLFVFCQPGYGPCHWSSLISGYAKRITTLASETNICFIVPLCYLLTTCCLGRRLCLFG